jgi:mxaJ protein
MSSRFPSFLCLLIALPTVAHAAPTTQTTPVLTVAADPNNLPFSNDKGEGFENRLAELIARDLGMKVGYYWHAQRRGFFRESLKENRADVVMGVPADFEMALTTAPYYTSSYVFIARKTSGIHVSSFDDPALRTLRVGVQVVDEGNTPPAQALGRRNIVNNVIGYSVYGNYAQPNPPSSIVRAVSDNEVDVAIAWGPLAGYFSKQSAVPLVLTAVSPRVDPPKLPMTFSVSVGVRRRDTELRDRIDQVLVRRREEVRKLLDQFGVPQVPDEPSLKHAASGANDDRVHDVAKVPGCCE